MDNKNCEECVPPDDGLHDMFIEMFKKKSILGRMKIIKELKDIDYELFMKEKLEHGRLKV
jgi:hypothetical protein